MVVVLVCAVTIAAAAMRSVIQEMDMVSMRTAGLPAADWRYVQASDSTLRSAAVALPVSVVGAIAVYLMHSRKR
jgi:hypothetical protein